MDGVGRVRATYGRAVTVWLRADWRLEAARDRSCAVGTVGVWHLCTVGVELMQGTVLQRGLRYGGLVIQPPPGL